MIIPMTLIVIFGLLWVVLGKPVEIHFTADTLFPSLTSTESWMGLTGIIASFLGLELATVHIRKVRNAKKTFPIALLIASVFMVFTMILGALAVSILFPIQHIDVVNGAVKSFRVFLDAFGLSEFFYIIVIMIFIGSLGSMINWMISPARGLFQAADDGFLPKWLTKTNEHDVPSNILILQAIIMTFVCLGITLVPSVQAYYFLLTVISTQIYSLMYMFMFFAAFKLKLQSAGADREINFKIPGDKIGMSIVCFLGLMGTSLCVVVGFVPPDSLYTPAVEFIPKLFGALFVTILPVIFFLVYRARTKS
jgi:amino acid transporter